MCIREYNKKLKIVTIVRRLWFAHCKSLIGRSRHFEQECIDILVQNGLTGDYLLYNDAMVMHKLSELTKSESCQS